MRGRRDIEHIVSAAANIFQHIFKKCKLSLSPFLSPDTLFRINSSPRMERRREERRRVDNAAMGWYSRPLSRLWLWSQT
jgi:hypothetical protein